MSKKSKQELLAHYTGRYFIADTKEKQRLLDEFVAITGYHRKYAIAALNHPRKPRLSPARRHRPWLNNGTTRPGTLLKHQIPIRTFAGWQDSRTGFAEVDLVAHCRRTTSGEYLNSLVLTGIATPLD